MSRIDMESLFRPIVGDPATMADKHYTRETASSTLRDTPTNPHPNPTTPEAPR